MAGAWVKLIPTRALNPKLRRAGLAARGLDEAAMCWCAQNGTDGFVSVAGVAMLAAEHGTRSWRPLAARLVAEGRWEEVDGGWLVHDYLEFNPSAAEWEALRQKKAAAGRAGGQARASANARAGPQADAQAVSFRFEETPQSSSSNSRPPSGPEDDGDARLRREAVDLLVRRHLADRMRSEVVARLGPVGDVVAWQAADRVKTTERHGERLKALTTGSSAELAELLEPTPRSTTVAPPPFAPPESRELPPLEQVRPNLEKSRAALMGRAK